MADTVLNSYEFDFWSKHANILPGACTGGAFLYGGGGIGTKKKGVDQGVLVTKEIGKPVTVEALTEAHYGPIGVGRTPSEVLVFVEAKKGASWGFVFAGDPKNKFINDSGISIGLFAGTDGHSKIGPIPAEGGFGGGAYLTFSNAANCLKKKK